ncbi:MAG: hypothetical protein ACAI34_13180 [Verrucomicrobium sp.]
MSLQAPLPVQAAGLSAPQLERIGKRIWQNECAGTVEGLTSWNKGEYFASLGIGHFIWYPAGVQGPFEESFPPLVRYLSQSGVDVPQWLLATPDCPWKTREAFEQDRNSPRLKELRAFLSRTVGYQTVFIIQRLEAATPKFKAAAGKAAPHVERNLAMLRQSAAGNFGLIDYVNFKGEGLNPKERYDGVGWGLLQVLVEMRPTDADGAPAAFAEAAKRVLTRRVQNAPAERKEQRWLEGWRNRCDGYKAG